MNGAWCILTECFLCSSQWDSTESRKCSTNAPTVVLTKGTFAQKRCQQHQTTWQIYINKGLCAVSPHTTLLICATVLLSLHKLNWAIRQVALISCYDPQSLYSQCLLSAIDMPLSSAVLYASWQMRNNSITTSCWILHLCGTHSKCPLLQTYSVISNLRTGVSTH